jgi:hypothetical protein
MDKISHEDMKALLKTAGASIRTLTAEKADLEAKVASYEREDEIRDIVTTMRDKRMVDDEDVADKVAELRTRQDLPVVKEAVNLAAVGTDIGVLGDDPSGGVDSRSALETFIMTGEDPRNT